MLRTCLYIGAGSFIGGIARYLLSRSVLIKEGWWEGFPAGTLAVNVLGCLAIGLIYALAERSGSWNEDWKLFLTVGCCGGFTTFSTFSHECLRMLQQGQTATAFLYIFLSLILGIGAAFFGWWIVKTAG